MSANLQTRLENSLNDILKASGYIFEIINHNKKQSNLITGPNNELIQQSIIQQLSDHIQGFNDILDQTVSKFNDAKWCVAVMIENKQKLEEETERQKREAEARRLKEEMEAKKKAEEEAAAKAAAEARAKEEEARAAARAKEEEARAAAMAKMEEVAAKAKAAMEQEKKEKEALRKKQEEEEEAQRKKLEQQKRENQAPKFDNFDEFIGFDINDMPNGDETIDEDMLSNINYEDLGLDDPMQGSSSTLQAQSMSDTPIGKTSDKVANMDLDMNNLLENDESILDGLNMTLLDGGLDGDNSNNDNQVNEEFDVDSFLNQFGN
ncbi:CTA2 subfamily 1 protein 5 orthologue, putative [Candida dubliniensis CD36]|uniref:Transcriptional activator, putative n=1 Tax=Candida dubliniensis (strain CD36 / ATCC MYA-646 / CBS 7987 / NCPF 3949 / NRRL Y-17841) TaxID=573826 RepID=B9WKI2_CANDC|nr:CTA2 subfamily 1 protein 5 orthologue, putative [Candida dubliniensis CD36]CAX40836.1 CTA2 subfamily 1 protein 5 orthologue, putative [Candida dubliniensis CD36]